MFKCFFPDEYVDSTYVIDFDNLYAQGYRGLLFDIDNTLVPHGAPADERACALFAHLKELGFKCCFLSNNQYERVSSFNDAIGEYFIEDAHKPSTKNYIRAMELLGTDRSNTIFVGDQLFTVPAYFSNSPYTICLPSVSVGSNFISSSQLFLSAVFFAP